MKYLNYLRVFTLLFLIGGSTTQVVAQVPVISYASPQSYNIGTPITPLAPSNSGGSVPTKYIARLRLLLAVGRKARTMVSVLQQVFGHPMGLLQMLPETYT
ncbi:MAG TPA: hypothetical protein VGB63_01530 [Pedobacter sp.]|jgi:hypothetical protein